MSRLTGTSETDVLLQEEMTDPDFRKAWEETELEDQVRRALIQARIQKRITQEELSRLSGLRQSNISRIESGSAVPSLRTLKKLAAGLGMSLRVEFVPKEASSGAK